MYVVSTVQYINRWMDRFSYQCTHGKMETRVYTISQQPIFQITVNGPQVWERITHYKHIWASGEVSLTCWDFFFICAELKSDTV